MKYERVISYVYSHPWAIKKETLGAILDVLVYRAEGGQFTDEQLAERLAETEARNAARRAPRVAGSVAVIPLYGSIFPRANLFTEFSGGTSLQAFGSVLSEVANDDKVGSIVLDVASPGGMVDLVPETGELIRQISKPIVAVANAQAASAAYWIASQADELVVTPSGEVGSIGVWMAHEDWSRHDGNLGVNTTLVSAGKYKVEANPFAPLSEEARAHMQEVVDFYYGMFTREVARGRGTNVATVRSGFGEGRMVTAPQAVAEGMADRVAPIGQIISELASGRAPAPRRAASVDSTGDDSWLLTEDPSGSKPDGAYEFSISWDTETNAPVEDPDPEDAVDFYSALLEQIQSS